MGPIQLIATLAASTVPVLDYPHLNGACAVTGGYVYRGSISPALQGTYFYADFCRHCHKLMNLNPPFEGLPLCRRRRYTTFVLGRLQSSARIYGAVVRPCIAGTVRSVGHPKRGWHLGKESPIVFSVP